MPTLGLSEYLDQIRILYCHLDQTSHGAGGATWVKFKMLSLPSVSVDICRDSREGSLCVSEGKLSTKGLTLIIFLSISRTD